jgi:hypothetical protein
MSRYQYLGLQEQTILIASLTLLFIIITHLAFECLHLALDPPGIQLLPSHLSPKSNFSSTGAPSTNLFLKVLVEGTSLGLG